MAVADSIAGRKDARRNTSYRPASAWRDGNLIEAASLAALVAAAVFLVQWHYGFNWGDEGWLWYISQRTALGDEVPVRDYFSYDPGRYYWSAVVFKLLGRGGLFEQILANYLFGVIGLTASYVAMARAGMRRPWRIAVLLLLGIALGFPRHKIFEQSLSLTSAAGVAWILSNPEKRKRWLIFGVATGLAAFIGRNSGLYFAVAGLLAFVLLRFRSRTPAVKMSVVPFLGGIAIGYSPMFFMMLRFRGFASAFINSLLLTTKWSWPLRIPFPWHSHAGGLHGLDAWQMHAVSWLCVAVPLFYLLIIWRGYKAELTSAWTLAVGASLAGLPYLHHAFYHADFPHIAQAVLPFILAVAAISHSLWSTGPRRWALVCFAGMAFLTLSCWLPAEPLVQHLRTLAWAPQSLAKIAIDGREFEVPANQAPVMNAVKAAFESCGPHDGEFMEAPFYPGLYAFLNVRAPFWDTYYLWPRSNDLQNRHIEALAENHTSVVLINRNATFDKQDWLRIGRTYPRLLDYVLSRYKRADIALPDGFDIYLQPGQCRVRP